MQQRARDAFMLATLLFLSLALSACGNTSTQADAVAENSTANNATGSVPPDSQRSDLMTMVNVIAIDFTYTLDQTEVSAGPIRFVIENGGTMQHDFAIQVNGTEQKSAMLEPGQSTTLKITLAPGTYTYRCTVPGHEILGMKGTLFVK